MARATDFLVDLTARRPTGWIARKTYGGPLGAPKGHEAVFDRMLEVLGPMAGEHCLEIGCGGGRLLQRVLLAGAAYAAGLDHSPDMLELSRKRNEAAIDRGLAELKLGEADKLPWPDRAFSVALSANTFFFIADPERLLAELSRVLSPGGRIVIATVPGPLPAPSLRNWWVYVWGSRMHVYEEASMRALLEGADFRDITVTAIAGEQPVQLATATR